MRSGVTCTPGASCARSRMLRLGVGSCVDLRLRDVGRCLGGARFGRSGSAGDDHRSQAVALRPSTKSRCSAPVRPARRECALSATKPMRRRRHGIACWPKTVERVESLGVRHGISRDGRAAVDGGHLRFGDRLPVGAANVSADGSLCSFARSRALREEEQRPRARNT